jgi:Uma2 family endonuclease
LSDIWQLRRRRWPDRLLVEEYLNTSYSPDREYRDGALIERNGGDKAHARLQVALGSYLHRRRKEWNVHVYIALRVKVRAGWYSIPDVCVYSEPDFEERYPSRPPLLWIEILTPDDRILNVWEKTRELLGNGVPYVWIINPSTLDSQLRTANGIEPVDGKTLRLPDSPIAIPLVDVMENY